MKAHVKYDALTFGCALSICISYAVHHSVGWAILHGILSWVYVIYALCGPLAKW